MGYSRLNSGDAKVVKDYVVVTIDQFHQFVCPELSKKAAEKRLGKLVKADLVAPHPLTGNKKCYSLTQTGMNLLGEKTRVKTLGSNTIIRNITINGFSTREKVKILSKDETIKRFAPPFFVSSEWPKGIPSNYCYADHSTEPPSFNCLILDMGKHIRRLHKHLESIHRRLDAFPVTQALLKDGLYRLVVLTGHDGKAESIRRLKLDYVVKVVVVPELGDLLQGEK